MISIKSCAVAALTLLASGVAGSGLMDCYGRDGSAHANNTRCPGSNACCGSEATCLSNRLCHNPNDGPNTFVRGPCAVNPYDSGTCAQICLYNETRGVFPRVKACADGSLCCDDDPQCCDNKDGTFLDERGLIADSAPASYRSYGPERTTATYDFTSIPSQTVVPSSTSKSSATPTSDEAENDKGDKDSGSGTNSLAIGLGVGIPVACILAAAAAFFFIRRRRRASAAIPSQPQEMADTTHEMGGTYAEQSPQDAPKAQASHPLNGAYAPVELEADTNTSAYDQPGEKYR